VTAVIVERKGTTGGCWYALCGTVWVSVLSNQDTGRDKPTHPHSVRPRRGISSRALGRTVLCDGEKEVLSWAFGARRHDVAVAVQAGAGRVFGRSIKRARHVRRAAGWPGGALARESWCGGGLCLLLLGGFACVAHVVPALAASRTTRSPARRDESQLRKLLLRKGKVGGLLR
jgi:hypothetical protein